VPFGTGSNQCGWLAVYGDNIISELPFSTASFRLFPGSGAANVITTLPAGYPTVDFYGNPIPAANAAAGAVQATVSGSGYNLELTVNDAEWGSVSASPAPNTDGLFLGAVTITASAKAGYEFSYWLKDGNQAGSINPLLLTISSHTRVQAVFGRSGVVSNLIDDMYAATTPGTLRYALVNAQDGDIIRFSGFEPGAGVIKLRERLEINKNVIIEGNGVTITRDTAWTVINNDSQLLYIHNNAEVIINRIHFKDGGTTMHGAVRGGKILLLDSCIFSGNRAFSGDYINGAAIFIQGHLTVKGCTFYGNSSELWLSGGAIVVYNSNNASLTLLGNLFYGNTASSDYPVVYVGYSSTTPVISGYNIVDVPLGTGYTQSGWNPAPTDKTFTDLSITGTPLNTATFAPVSGLNIIPSAPEGFPTTDFYGNARTFPGAPGAVK
jgi:hypothetical protein